MTNLPDDVSADLTGQYLKKHDAADGPLLLTISSVAKQLFDARAGKPAESKWTITFAGDNPPKMTLNKTNLSILAKAFGVKTAYWIGQQVEVYVDEGVMFAGQLTGGLRVRAVKRGVNEDTGFGDALPAV